MYWNFFNKVHIYYYKIKYINGDIFERHKSVKGK